MSKRWTYSDATIQRVSSMVCTVCRQKIVDGAFRFRETEDAYLPQHKACCSDDPEWAAIQRRQNDYAEQRRRSKLALRKYIDEFGEPDIDLIDEVLNDGFAPPSRASQGAEG